MGDTLLVRYGELALKSPPVRREFEGRLKHNLLESFLRAQRTCTLSADHGHLYVHTADAESAVPLVRRVFGVTSVSPAIVVPTDVPSITSTVVQLAGPRLTPGCRFAVRARRTGSHPFSSQTLAADLGAALLERYADRGLRVDLKHPDVELYVEVRDNRTYIYQERFEGPGGLPLGVAGRVGAYVDGVRGALGAYLLMKRGCRVFPLCSAAGSPLVREVLAKFDGSLENPPECADAAAAWGSLEKSAAERRWDGVVLPLDVEDYERARQQFGETVIFSPTVGLSDQEVERRWSDVRGLLGAR